MIKKKVEINYDLEILIHGSAIIKGVFTEEDKLEVLRQLKEIVNELEEPKEKKNIEVPKEDIAKQESKKKYTRLVGTPHDSGITKEEIEVIDPLLKTNMSYSKMADELIANFNIGKTNAVIRIKRYEDWLKNSSNFK